MNRVLIRLCLLLAVLGMGRAARADGFIVVHDIRPPVVPPVRPIEHFAFAPLEVVYHRVDVAIDGLVATVRIDQEFHNPNTRVLEGTYLFPLPDGARIDRFAMDIEGKMTDAELLPADKARAIYEDIVRRQRDPALLEYVGRGAFKARIFPLEPRKGKRIRIEYTQLLKSEGGLLEYVYPLNTEKFSATPLKDVSVKVSVVSDAPIRAVYCPSHPVEIRRDGDRKAVAGYEAKDVRPDTDFRLVMVRDERPGAMRVLFHREGDEGFFMLLAGAPALPADAKPPAKDVCFVLDTSGSMSGGKLDQAKKALRFCLDNLNDGDRFEIVRFSTEAESLFDGLRPADAAARATAAKFVDGFRPIGGTAIADALRKALDAGKKRASADGGGMPPYLVVFLTDGLPTIGEMDEDKLVAMAGPADGAPVRVFSFGIGNDVNTHLLDRIARRTRASSQYVSASEDLELKLTYFYSRIKDPVLTDLALAVDAAGVRLGELWPSTLPDLFRHDVLAVFGRYTLPGAGDVSGTVTLSGKTAGGAETVAAKTVFPAAESRNAYIPRLWAARRVAWLLDEIRLRGESAELREEATRLARAYGIVTPYTAYLILEDEARRNVPLARQSFPDLRGDRSAGAAIRRQYESVASERNLPAARSGAEAVGNARALQALAGGVAPMTSVAPALSTAAGDRQLRKAEAMVRDEAAAYSFSLKAPAALERSRVDAPALAPSPEADPRAFAEASKQRRSDLGYRAEQRLNYATQAKVVNNRAFYQNSRRWVDATAQQQASWPTETVMFASDAYFALLDRHPDARAWLALGDDMDLVLDGRLYQIRPE